MAIGPAFPDEALERANLALKNHRAKDAERIAADMLRADPRHTRALHILGCALLAQGRAEDAVALLENAARGKHDPEIDAVLAMALRQAGRSEGASSVRCCSRWAIARKRSRRSRADSMLRR
jgi:Flp pilus assembly protein TadD